MIICRQWLEGRWMSTETWPPMWLFPVLLTPLFASQLSAALLATMLAQVSPPKGLEWEQPPAPCSLAGSLPTHGVDWGTLPASYWVVQVIRLGFRLPWCSAKAPLSTCSLPSGRLGILLPWGLWIRRSLYSSLKVPWGRWPLLRPRGFAGEFLWCPRLQAGGDKCWISAPTLDFHEGHQRIVPSCQGQRYPPEGLPHRLACTGLLPGVVLAPLSAGPAPVPQLGFLSQRGEIQPQALTAVRVPRHDLRHPVMVGVAGLPMAYSACSPSCPPCFTGTGPQNGS